MTLLAKKPDTKKQIAIDNRKSIAPKLLNYVKPKQRQAKPSLSQCAVDNRRL